jgi:hypothetical protein
MDWSKIRKYYKSIINLKYKVGFTERHMTKFGSGARPNINFGSGSNKQRLSDPGGSGSRSITLKRGLAKKMFSQFISFCGWGELEAAVGIG